MKTEFVNTNDLFLEITVIPETVEETVLLAKYSTNASAEKPYVRFSFRNNPYCYICLKMIKSSSSGARFSLFPKHQKH
jgi:hypothetical protein